MPGTACRALLARGITGRLKVCWLGRPCADATRARGTISAAWSPRPKVSQPGRFFTPLAYRRRRFLSKGSPPPSEIERPSTGSADPSVPPEIIQACERRRAVLHILGCARVRDIQLRLPFLYRLVLIVCGLPQGPIDVGCAQTIITPLRKGGRVTAGMGHPAPAAGATSADPLLSNDLLVLPPEPPMPKGVQGTSLRPPAHP